MKRFPDKDKTAIEAYAASGHILGGDSLIWMPKDKELVPLNTTEERPITDNVYVVPQIKHIRESFKAPKDRAALKPLTYRLYKCWDPEIEDEPPRKVERREPKRRKLQPPEEEKDDPAAFERA